MRKTNSAAGKLFLFVIIIAAYANLSSIASDANADYLTPKEPPKAHYKIEFSIDPIKGNAGGRENVRFKNTTSHPIDCLAFKWQTIAEQNMEIKVEGKPVSVFRESGSEITVVELSEAIAPDESINIEVKFSASMPGGMDVDILPLTYWFPRLWWGFETHEDYDVKVNAPKTYKIATSGVLNNTTGYYNTTDIRSFGIVLLKNSEVLEAKAQNIIVKCYYRSNEKKCAELLLDTATDVINFYRERFGFYPNSCLSIIPGADRFMGGYPIATNIVSIHGMGRMDEEPELHWKWITAHEIGHQYWLEYVLSKDPTQQWGWLMIGLGIYADREYTRAKGLGPDKHQGFIERYIQGVREGNDTTVNISEEEAAKINFDFNNVVTHGKGYSIISALDCLLGRDVFNKAYLRCLEEYGGRRMGAAEFQAVCEAESGQDLEWFFTQWLNSNRYLSYEITSKKCERKGDVYISEIEVKRLGDLKMPVPVEAVFEDGGKQVKFTNRLLDTNVVRFESKSALKQARLDPENALALIVPPPQLTEQQLSDKIHQLSWTGSGKQALEIFEKAKETKLSDPDDWFKLGLVLYGGKYYNESLNAWQFYEKLSEKNSTDYYIAKVWQGHNYDLLGQRDKAVECYKEALKCEDEGIWTQHDQYGMVINRDWVKQRLETPHKRD